ncbi:hypothetical protein AKJ16_DCAP10568 [Drosera capensis]
MEGKKQVKGSCSSSKFPSELFGAKETAKNDVFSSIFAANKVEGSRQKQLKQAISGPQVTIRILATGFIHSSLYYWIANIIPLVSDNADKNSSSTHRSTAYKDNNSTLHEEKSHPCYLSSSLYYGGQEMYHRSPAKKTPGSYYKKDDDDKDDDSSGNSSYGVPRGNWWEGSLYY